MLCRSEHTLGAPCYELLSSLLRVSLLAATHAQQRRDRAGKLHRRMVFDITSRHKLIRIAKLDCEWRLHQNPLDREKGFWPRSAPQPRENTAQKGYFTIRHRLHRNDHGALPIRWSRDGRDIPDLRVQSIHRHPDCHCEMRGMWGRLQAVLQWRLGDLAPVPPCDYRYRLAPSPHCQRNRRVVSNTRWSNDRCGERQ